jgi:hypothetical protein
MTISDAIDRFAGMTLGQPPTRRELTGRHRVG